MSSEYVMPPWPFGYRVDDSRAHPLCNAAGADTRDRADLPHGRR
jgi:hypothetical protein